MSSHGQTVEAVQQDHPGSDLKEAGALLCRQEHITHSVPPLLALQRAGACSGLPSSGSARSTSFNEDAVKAIDNVEWIPAWGAGSHYRHGP